MGECDEVEIDILLVDQYPKLKWKVEETKRLMGMVLEALHSPNWRIHGDSSRKNSLTKANPQSVHELM